MPRPTTIDSQSMGRHKQQGAERAARLSLARMTSNGPLDGVSRAKVLLCCLSTWGRLIYLLLDKHVPAYVCTSRGEGSRPGQPAYKGMRGKKERVRGREGGKLEGGACGPCSRSTREARLPPVRSDRNNGELGSGGGHWPFMLLAWGLLLIRRIGAIYALCVVCLGRRLQTCVSGVGGP